MSSGGGVTMVRIDPVNEKVVMDIICRHLFKEWGENYIYRYNVKNTVELREFYRKYPIEMYAALSNDGTFRGCYSYSKKGALYWLSDMYVVPMCRGQGIGKLMVDHALRGGGQVALYSLPGTVPYYEMFGFKLGSKRIGTDLRGQTFEFYPMLYTPPMNPNTHLEIMGALLLFGVIVTFLIVRLL